MHRQQTSRRAVCRVCKQSIRVFDGAITVHTVKQIWIPGREPKICTGSAKPVPDAG